MAEPKDKEYEKHLKAQEADRPKDYPTFRVETTEDYVKAWCLRNNLVNDAGGLRLIEEKRPKRPRGKTPQCKCGKPCSYYGPVGGFSVKCEDCNAANSARQRRRRKELKDG